MGPNARFANVLGTRAPGAPRAHAVFRRALPDAARHNWVDRLAPARLRPWLKLGRFDRPAGIWLLMLPGWQGVALGDAIAGRGPDVRLLVLIALGATAMRAAGCAFNDIVDRDMDAQVARTAGRPVASGRISAKAAWVFLVGLSLLALCVLLTLNLTAILLGVASLGLVAAYPFMKRITWWPQAWLGLTFNWGALLGFAAVQGRLGWPAGLLYARRRVLDARLRHHLRASGHRGRRPGGHQSSARRLGPQVRRGVAVFYALASGLAVSLTVASPWSLLPALGFVAPPRLAGAPAEARRRSPGAAPCSSPTATRACCCSPPWRSAACTGDRRPARLHPGDHPAPVPAAHA